MAEAQTVAPQPSRVMDEVRRLDFGIICMGNEMSPASSLNCHHGGGDEDRGKGSCDSAKELCTSENLRTGRVVTTTQFQLVGERLPDIGVTIRSASQELLAQCRLLGLNLQHPRFGRFDAPIDVEVHATSVLDPGP